MQDKATRSDECNRLYVCCCPLPRVSERPGRAACRRSRTDSLLQRKGSRNVFSHAICHCTGNKFSYASLAIMASYISNSLLVLYIYIHTPVLIKFHHLFQALVEIPYVLAQAVVYGVIVYAMIGFEWTAAKFFWSVFFMFFTLLYFTFFGINDCCCHTKSTYCCHHCCCILWIMEPFFRFYSPTNCECS